MSRILLTRRAETDLDDIWLHIALENPIAADGVIDAIVDHANIVSAQPLAARARPELAADLRSFPEGSYVVFYEPLSDGIRIIRVLHGARDVDVIFADDKNPDQSY